MLTDPSISVVPAGRCSWTTRKSRCHSGVFQGTFAEDGQGDAGTPSEADLGGQVLERRRVDRDRESDRQGLAVELRIGRRIGPAFDPGDATGPGLFGAELAGEAREHRRVAELAPAFHREPDPVGLADLDRGPRDGDGLARGGSLDVEHGDLGVVDGHGQPVPILGASGPAVERRQGGQGRSPGLDAVSSPRRRGARPASRRPDRARARPA